MDTSLCSSWDYTTLLGVQVKGGVFISGVSLQSGSKYCMHNRFAVHLLVNMITDQRVLLVPSFCQTCVVPCVRMGVGLRIHILNWQKNEGEIPYSRNHSNYKFGHFFPSAKVNFLGAACSMSSCACS